MLATVPAERAAPSAPFIATPALPPESIDARIMGVSCARVLVTKAAASPKPFTSLTEVISLLYGRETMSKNSAFFESCSPISE